jgi:hypothetical protein
MALETLVFYSVGIVGAALGIISGVSYGAYRLKKDQIRRHF